MSSADRPGNDQADPASADEPRRHPFDRAFALELEEGCGAEGQGFAGRVEHLRSNRRFRFASAAELVAIVRTFLAGEDGSRGGGRR